jgi:outer membrane protein assembly factor BamA
VSAGILILAISALAQSHASIPAADRKLIEIAATGSQRFTSAEIAAASGLMSGAIADEEVFRKAARQLGESGAFGAISFNYSYSSAGTKLAFQVTDAEKFIPAHFIDFVWLPEKDLFQKIHERVPLFHGELPASGRLPDQVSDVLQALLVEGAIPGRVEYLRADDKTGHLASIDYSVANVRIRIDRIEFTGVSEPEKSQLEAAAEKLSAREYSHATLNAFIDQVVLPAYREHGYLRAACAPPQPSVVKPSHAADANPDPNDEHREITYVHVLLAVSPGIAYKLSGWIWSGNQAIATATLQAMLNARIGAPADTILLESDLRSVRQLYGSRGYVTATVRANAEYNDAAQSVRYHLDVTEGPVFHMGDLEFRGIDNGLTDRLRAAWKLRQGDVFNASYLAAYLPIAKKLLPPSIDWDVTPHVTAIVKDRTVDVDLQYTAHAPK